MSEQPQHQPVGDAEPEGTYPDRDVTDEVVPEPVGSYTDRDPVHEGAPDDEGSYEDRDVVDEHRSHEPEGGYTDAGPA